MDMDVIRLSLFEINNVNPEHGKRLKEEYAKQCFQKPFEYNYLYKTTTDIHWGSTDDPPFYMGLYDLYKIKVIAPNHAKIVKEYEIGDRVNLKGFGEAQLSAFRLGTCVHLHNQQEIVYRAVLKTGKAAGITFWITQTSLKSFDEDAFEYDSKYKGKATMETIRIRAEDA